MYATDARLTRKRAWVRERERDRERGREERGTCARSEELSVSLPVFSVRFLSLSLSLSLSLPLRRYLEPNLANGKNQHSRQLSHEIYSNKIAILFEITKKNIWTWKLIQQELNVNKIYCNIGYFFCNSIMIFANNIIIFYIYG